MINPIDYMLQNVYNFVAIHIYHEYITKEGVYAGIVTDGTRTDFMQFTHI